ncbi:DUF1003 domain-containing protein [archaeon]|jgi:uncharacterized membrane protein|nr:DUF1003 domain-containing protein [archaeon]MBT4397684.1 DUF1003 domain-containing protein [archaeon]MBT4441620.1 DUF1003 domain-containing protein [archaeon]
MKKVVKKKKGHPIIIKELTIGQKAADKVTTFCGSWSFILSVIGLIFVWIILNSLAFINHWDPWPFIILNLTLSCLAALQAPIILMSQNRQAERDRIQVKYDYTVDRKAERGIRQLLKDVATMKKYMYENKKLTAPKKLKTKK